MDAVIFRGSTPTLTFKPTNGMSVADLGTPTVAVAQDVAYLEKTGEDVVVDTASNSISVKLSEADTLALVPGVETRAQMVWKSENNVFRFPEHTITVMSTLMEEA